jgi:hypothetical protein
MFPEGRPQIREWSVRVRGSSLAVALDFALRKHGLVAA